MILTPHVNPLRELHETLVFDAAVNVTPTGSTHGL